MADGIGWFRVGLLFLAFLWGGAAHAKVPPAAPLTARQKADAESHFKQGKAHLDARNYEEAITEFKRAYEIAGAPNAFFYLAEAYRLNGDPERALEDYRSYVNARPNGSMADEARQRIAELTRALKDGRPTPPPVAPPTEPPVAEPEPPARDPQPDPPAAPRVENRPPAPRQTAIEPPPITRTRQSEGCSGGSADCGVIEPPKRTSRPRDRGYGRLFVNAFIGTGIGAASEGSQAEVVYQYHGADGTHGVSASNSSGIGYFRPLTIGAGGMALSVLHGAFEVGVNITGKLAVSALLRVQGTLINNADSSPVCPDTGQTSVFGCSTKNSNAFAGMARFRYSFLEGRFRPALHVGFGGGTIRHVLDVTEAGHSGDNPPLTDAGTAQFYEMARKDPKAVPGAPSTTTQNFVCPTYPATCVDTIKMGYLLAAVGFSLSIDVTKWRNGGLSLILDNDFIFGFGDQFGFNYDLMLGIGAHFL